MSVYNPRINTETTTVFPGSGYVVGSSTVLHTTDRGLGLPKQDGGSNCDSVTSVAIKLPSSYASESLRAELLFISDESSSGGDVSIYVDATFGANAETYGLESATYIGLVSVGNNEFCVTSLPDTFFENADADDIVSLIIKRNGTNSSDDYSGTLYLAGVRFVYQEC